jgi:hypothetical protein
VTKKRDSALSFRKKSTITAHIAWTVTFFRRAISSKLKLRERNSSYRPVVLEENPQTTRSRIKRRYSSMEELLLPNPGLLTNARTKHNIRIAISVLKRKKRSEFL